MRYASNKVSDYLFLSRDVQQRDFEDCLGKDPGVLDTIIAESDKIRNIELTETFHKEDDEQLDEEELKAANAEYEEERLKRDDPEAWLLKYGQRPKPAQGPTFTPAAGIQSSPFFTAVNRDPYQSMVATPGSTQAGGSRTAQPNKAGKVGNQFAGIIRQGGIPNQSAQPRAHFLPAQTESISSKVQQALGGQPAARQGAPSPPSTGNSPPMQGAHTPNGPPDHENTMPNDPEACKPQ